MIKKKRDDHLSGDDQAEGHCNAEPRYSDDHGRYEKGAEDAAKPWVIATRSFSSPRAQTISVAEGSRETIFIS